MEKKKTLSAYTSNKGKTAKDIMNNQKIFHFRQWIRMMTGSLTSAMYPRWPILLGMQQRRAPR